MIPNAKIKDMMGDKQKAFLEIEHSHTGKPTSLQGRQCQRCHFDVAEQSLVDYIKNHTGLEKTKSKNSAGVMETYTFKELQVKRGSLDDCIGWIILWS